MARTPPDFPPALGDTLPCRDTTRRRRRTGGPARDLRAGPRPLGVPARPTPPPAPRRGPGLGEEPHRPIHPGYARGQGPAPEPAGAPARADPARVLRPDRPPPHAGG